MVVMGVITLGILTCVLSFIPSIIVGANWVKQHTHASTVVIKMIIVLMWLCYLGFCGVSLQYVHSDNALLILLALFVFYGLGKELFYNNTHEYWHKPLKQESKK